MRSMTLLVGVWLLPAVAAANGSYSHVHMSQLAADALPPGELATLLAAPENRVALEAGSYFPDSGYSIGHDYGELTHWEPFLIELIAHLRVTYDGDFSSPEAQRAVAFLLGIASHGLADQSYDTTLLARSFEVDGPEDPARSVDQFADYFIVVDDGVVFEVEAWAPYAELVPAVIAAGVSVDEATLTSGVTRMATVVNVQGNPRTVRNLYWDAWESYPFLGSHVYNPAAVGSLPWVAEVIQAYWQVLFDRLRATDDVDAQLVIRAVPEDGGVNWPVDLAASEAWGRPALWFGYGIDRDQLAPLISMRAAASGEAVPFTIQTAYGGRDRNLVFLRPEGALAHDTEYTIELAAGVETLDGRITTEPFLTSFRTRCAPDRLGECPPLDPPLVTGEVPMRPVPPDAGPGMDAGPPPMDAGPGTPVGGGCATARGPTASAGLALALAVITWRVRRRRGSKVASPEAR